MRNGPYYPDMRPERTAVVHYKHGRNSPGTVWAAGDTPGQVADAFNRAFEAGREAALSDIRKLLGVSKGSEA